MSAHRCGLFPPTAHLYCTDPFSNISISQPLEQKKIEEKQIY